MKRYLWAAGFVLLLAAGLGGGLWLGMRRPPVKPVVSTEAWLERLRSEDINEGTRAWQELADMGEAGLPVLLAARKDSDVRVHRRAALGLVKLGAPAVPALVEVLPRAGDRAELILVRVGKPAVPELEKALRSPEKAPSAARVLGGMGENAHDAVPSLAALLLDAKAGDESRAAAARALGRIGPENPDMPQPGDLVVTALTAALAAPGKVRIEAARALGGCGRAGRPALKVLVRLARDRDAEVAEAACAALGRLGSADAAEALAWRVAQADAASATAAAALARLGPAAKPGVEALVASLAGSKGEAPLARAALERLGLTAVPALESALKSEDVIVRRGAADVLGLMGPRAAGAAVALGEMLTDDDPAVVLSAAAALIRVDPENVGPILGALEPLLTHQVEAVASAAAAVAGDLGQDAGPLAPVFVGLLASKDVKAVRRAAEALGRLRSGGEALNALLKNPAVRPDAAVALMRIDRRNARRVAEALAADLAGEDGNARRRALAALATMQPPPAEAVPALAALLERDESVPEVLLVLARSDLGDGQDVLPHLITRIGAAGREGLLASVVVSRTGEAAGPFLLVALRSRSPQTRAAAVRLLRTPLAAVPALEDESESVRLEAVRAAGGAEGAEAKLVPLLSHRSERLRAAAVAALRGRESAEVRQALAECAFDPDAAVRAALEREEPGKRPGKAEDLRADDLDVRLWACEQRWPAKELTERVLPLLSGVLEGWDEPARERAAQALAALGPAAKPVLPALRRRLRRDDSDDVRRACEGAIKAIGR